MEAKFNIHDNNFYDYSSVVRTGGVEDSVSLQEITAELNQIKIQLNQEGELFQAIEKLQEAISTNDKHKISNTIKKYVKDFSLPFFANVASDSLRQFMDKF